MLKKAVLGNKKTAVGRVDGVWRAQEAKDEVQAWHSHAEKLKTSSGKEVIVDNLLSSVNETLGISNTHV